MKFDGRNLLNDTPCTFVGPREDRDGAEASVQRCRFSETWGANKEFVVTGRCNESGLPPFEQAGGTATAAPKSNCAGATDQVS